jgi:hypothetical protein
VNNIILITLFFSVSAYSCDWPPEPEDHSSTCFHVEQKYYNKIDGIWWQTSSSSERSRSHFFIHEKKIVFYANGEPTNCSPTTFSVVEGDIYKKDESFVVIKLDKIERCRSGADKYIKLNFQKRYKSDSIYGGSISLFNKDETKTYWNGQRATWIPVNQKPHNIIYEILNANP